MPISDEVKRAIRERANYICEYCHSSERLSANRFTADHIIPKSLGGSDEINNLALACRRCNERRYNFVAGVDLETQAIVPILILVGKIGRITLFGSIKALRLKELRQRVGQLAFGLI